jgi:hypothetical protein
MDDPKVVEFMTIQIFKQCFKSLYTPTNTPSDEEMVQCLSNYIRDYEVVGSGFMLNHSEVEN